MLFKKSLNSNALYILLIILILFYMFQIKFNVNKDMFIVMYKRLHNFEDSTNDKKHTETH